MGGGWIEVVAWAVEVNGEEVDAVVKPQLVGQIPKGYILTSMDIQPERIRVLAPMELISNKIIKLMTTPIYMDNAREDKVIYCNIIAPRHVQPVVEKNWPVIEIKLNIKRRAR